MIPKIENNHISNEKYINIFKKNRLRNSNSCEDAEERINVEGTV